MRRMKKTIAIAGVVALLAPATAVASSSSDEGYNGPGNVVQGLQQGGGGGGGGGGNESQPVSSQPVKATSQGGKLPFTGADLGVLAAAGGLLAGLGFGLRRLTHRPTEA
jgi:hypothetical protein